MSMEEYANELDTNPEQVWFLLSFFKGGLSEKFAANYINKIINQMTISSPECPQYGSDCHIDVS
jgi:hypothetical protein